MTLLILTVVEKQWSETQPIVDQRTFTLFEFLMNFSEITKGTSSRAAKTKQSFELTFIGMRNFQDPLYFHETKSYQHPEPPRHLPSFRLWRGDERLFYSPLYLSTSTLSSSPALSQPSSTLITLDYSRFRLVWGMFTSETKTTLALGTEKRKGARQNIQQISNLHENKPHCSAGKKWIEMRTCQERGGIISIWPNKRASTEL